MLIEPTTIILNVAFHFQVHAIFQFIFIKALVHITVQEISSGYVNTYELYWFSSNYIFIFYLFFYIFIFYYIFLKQFSHEQLEQHIDTNSSFNVLQSV